MALKKWGEIKSKRGSTGAIIGAVIGAVLGFISISNSGDQTTIIIGLLVGFVLGYLIGHNFDRTKTIVYKEELQNEKPKDTMKGKRSLVKISPSGEFFHCPFCNASLETQHATQCPKCKKTLIVDG